MYCRLVLIHTRCDWL